MKSKKICPNGFTLIELIVTISIAGILMVVIFANFGSFNKSRRLSEAADDLVGELRSANTKGFAGDRPCSTGTWSGWEAKYLNTTQYQIRPSCSPEASWITYTLSNGVEFGSNWGSFSFQALDQGISNAVSMDLVLNDLDLIVNVATTGAIYVEN